MNEQDERIETPTMGLGAAFKVTEICEKVAVSLPVDLRQFDGQAVAFVTGFQARQDAFVQIFPPQDGTRDEQSHHIGMAEQLGIGVGRRIDPILLQAVTRSLHGNQRFDGDLCLFKALERCRLDARAWQQGVAAQQR